MKRLYLLLPFAVSLFIGCAKAPPPPPPAPSYFEHKVSSQGETFGIIASWFTGTSKNWQLIAAANPEIKPNKIRIGNIIKIPSELVKRTDNIPKKLLLKAEKVADPSTTATTTQTQPSIESSSSPSDTSSTAPANPADPSMDAAQRPLDTARMDLPAELQTAPTVAIVEPKTEPSDGAKPQDQAPNAEEKSRDDLIDEILNQ